MSLKTATSSNEFKDKRAVYQREKRNFQFKNQNQILCNYMSYFVPMQLLTSLLQVDDKEVIYFLLKTEIVPYCLRCMDVGKGLSKTVSSAR